MEQAEVITSSARPEPNVGLSSSTPTGGGGGADERALLALHAAGDARAFAEIVERYRAPVYGYLVRCGVDRTTRDDVFQEIFMRVHGAAHRFGDEEKPFRPWLFAIVTNTVRTHWRKQRVRSIVAVARGEATERTIEHAADPAPNGEAISLAKETASFIERAIESLPLQQREVVVLACVEHMTMEDVAGALEIPVNTVKTLLRRARMTLASQLARRSARADWEISR